MSGAHRYSIRAKDPGAHLYEVRLTVAAPDPGGQVFGVPAWIPGSYMIRDFARHVVAIRAESAGREVPLQKLDTSRWQAAAVKKPLTLIAEVYAYDDNVRGAHLDTTHAYFNGPCVFPEVLGQDELACELDILAPEAATDAWRVATSMRRQGAKPYGFGTYIADNYAELIDHPVEIGELAIGEFDVDGIPHAIAIRGRTRVDMQRLCDDLAVLCRQHLQLLGAPPDLDRYLFLLHAPGNGYGGLEHCWSSSLVCSRDNLPRPGEKEVSEGYRTFLGLASHEYFHLWNVKRLKPAAFTPYRLAAETHTELLWVFEGITSYYDDLALVRSGLVTDDSYLELLGRTITRVLRNAGRMRQSVAASSFDAWSKFYKQDANSPNAIVSYYTKGALIALTLDLRLREETEDRITLDDVMRACWDKWGSGAEGMPEDGFESVCAAVSGIDLGEFFDTYVRDTAELPLQEALATVGVEYHLRRATNRSDKGGKAADNGKTGAVWLGAELGDKEGKPVFAAVHNGGPAERAGIAPGDVAVALDGLALTVENYDRRLKACNDGDVLELAFFRGDELLTSNITLAATPENTCYLLFEKEPPADTEARRASWLHPK